MGSRHRAARIAWIAGISAAASGTTPFVRGALKWAQESSAATVFVTCVPEAQVPDAADVTIRLF